MEYYLIVLGLYDTEITEVLQKRMNGIGNTENIFDNMYILSADDDSISSSIIRDTIAGEERYYVLTINMRNNIDAAWCIPKTKVNFINDMIKSKN